MVLQIELFLIESKGIANFEKHFSFFQSVSLLRGREEDRAWEQGCLTPYIEHFCGRLEGLAILISRMPVIVWTSTKNKWNIQNAI